MNKTTINSVADYIIVKLVEGGVGLNILKLQKLLYYVQAWHLAIKGESFFVGKFQAWVHGPVNRQIYDRFASSHTMYDLLGLIDVQKEFDLSNLSEYARSHIDEILDAYAALSGPQLEAMTHDEEPWIRARGNRKPAERCEEDLNEDIMKTFYKKLLEDSAKR